MKRVLYLVNLILICCLAYTCNVSAKTVGYTHKLLTLGGCVVRFSVAKQDTSYYIVVTVKSDGYEGLLFMNEPKMKVRTFNDEVITFDGVAIRDGSISAGIVSGNILIPVAEIRSTAQFKVTPSQFEKIGEGVAKVGLSTTPTNHEHKFKKDKIGKKLYQFYLKVKEQDEIF